MAYERHLIWKNTQKKSSGEKWLVKSSHEIETLNYIWRALLVLKKTWFIILYIDNQLGNIYSRKSDIIFQPVPMNDFSPGLYFRHMSFESWSFLKEGLNCFLLKRDSNCLWQSYSKGEKKILLKNSLDLSSRVCQLMLNMLLAYLILHQTCQLHECTCQNGYERTNSEMVTLSAITLLKL